MLVALGNFLIELNVHRRTNTPNAPQAMMINLDERSALSAVRAMTPDLFLDGARYGLFSVGDGRLFIGGIIDDAIPLAPMSGHFGLLMAEGEEKQWSSP